MIKPVPFFIDFRRITKPEELAKCLGISPEIFEVATAAKKSSAFYLRHKLVKRSHHRFLECREVWEVFYPLANAYKALARQFEGFVRIVEKRFPHDAAYGYVRHRSTVDNAKNHCGAPLLLRADLENFFPSISAKRLVETFLRLGLTNEIAEMLARFVTMEDRLAVGFHTSPMLANLICLDLDDKLAALAEKYGCIYTRYADDMAISGKEHLPSREEISAIVEQEGFSLCSRKFRITKPGQAHYVTGLSISDARRPRVPRRLKKRLRQELHYCKLYGVESHIEKLGEQTIEEGINRIDGMVRYISYIEKESMPNLRKEWAELLKKDELHNTYSSRHIPIRCVEFYIDESEIEYEGMKYLAICMVRTEEDDFIAASTEQILRDYIADPFTGSKKEVLEKKNLHYSDADAELRTLYIKKLAHMPYDAYLAYAQLPSPAAYSDVYLSLVRKLLPHRLIGYDRAVVDLIFEENPRVPSNAISETVKGIYEFLEKGNGRRPIALPTVTIGKKSEYHCFSVPDFLLGVFSKYARCQNNPPSMEVRDFERLRDKYRIIVDADSGIPHSRKRPFLPWAVATTSV